MATKKEIAKRATMSAIMDAAIREFAEKGYEKATTRSIAAIAGITNGLVTQYFGSKEELLCTIVNKYDLNDLYAGYTDDDPYRIFCIFLDGIRKIRDEDPAFFKLHLAIVKCNDFPESVYETIRKRFEGSKLEAAIVKARQDDGIIDGDPFAVFKLLVGSIYVLLNQYAVIGTAAPDNDALLNIVGYDRKNKLISQQQAQISAMEKDLSMLLELGREQYPLSISINLSRNTYHMIDYDNYSTRKADPEGSYDELIKVGASTIPDRIDREKFRKLFHRESLLQAFQNGERERSLIHRQTGDDGVVHWISTRCAMRQDPDGDIIAIAVGCTIDEQVRREIENTRQYRDHSLFIEIFNNISAEA